jgi:hypothetical protein
MSPSYHDTTPDRRAGFVLIAVFALGILGASLATIISGGEVPDATRTTMYLVKTDAPL